MGSALGTAIIAGALVVGDTFDSSIRDIARVELGPVDQVVTVVDLNQLAVAHRVVAGGEPIEGVDGVAAMTALGVAVANTEGPPRSVPSTTVGAADLDSLRDLGAKISGLADAGPNLDTDSAIINETIAAALGVGPGDAIDIFAYGESSRYTVRDVVPEEGLGGFAPVIVKPGTLTELAASSPGTEPPVGWLLVSNDGGIFDSTEDSPRIQAETSARLVAAGISHDQRASKANILADAKDEGEELTEIFSVVGGFSVLAGVLLLINLFVMLAEERKTTLGVLRALGWRRGHLVRSFVLEGAMYAMAATVVGAMGGVGVGWAIVKVTNGIFTTSNENLDLKLAIEPTSLLTASLIGLIISLVVIWATSWRISRLNIIRATRDLPDPVTARSRRRSLIVGLAGMMVGTALFGALGLGADSPPAAMAGPSIAALSAIGPLRQLLRSDAVAVLCGSAAAVWPIAVFTVLAGTMDDPDISIFLIQGVLLVAGTVVVAGSASPLWAGLLARTGRGSGPASRLALAYPLARRFRTGISLAMFSLILFSLTFIAVLSAGFAAKTHDFVAETSAGYDAIVHSNRANPLPLEDLRGHEGVESASAVLRGFPRFSAPFDPETLANPPRWGISGIDDGFATQTIAPTLVDRPELYPTDRAVFEAVATDPTLVVVATWFLGSDDGYSPALGDTVFMHNSGGARFELSIVGLVENDFVFAGAYVSADLMSTALPGEYSARRHYITFAPESNETAVAAAIDGQFVANGADTELFAELVAEEVREQQGFFNLLSGYLSAGLLIGVGGLAVVMVRAVRERRRQIGTLRAMGMQSRSVGLIFLTEGTFVALQGIVSGVGLGLASSAQLLSSTSLGEEFSYTVPVLAVTAVMIVPLVGSIVATLVPARRAAALLPAEALRLGD